MFHLLLVLEWDFILIMDLHRGFYVNGNYIPDGRGITYNCETVLPEKQVTLDDDLVLWFTKLKK
jgi:hypothetical protein